MSEPIRNQVFLSYAHEDLKIVRRIFSELTKRQLSVWFDKEHLGPGPWKSKITKAITTSRYFVICISNHALKKTGSDPGFQDEELNIAYKVALNQSDEEFTIVPVRLEACERGDFRVRSFKQYDLFNNFEKAIDKLAVDLGGVALLDTNARDRRMDDKKLADKYRAAATVAFYAGDYVESIKLADIVIKLMPMDASAWVIKGAAFDKLGRYDEALWLLIKP